MRCHMHTEDGERFFLPGCMGGAVYGKNGCTCPPESRKGTEQRLYDLEARVKALESALAHPNQQDKGS